MNRARSLRNETALNSISPERAGGIMYDTLAYLNQQVVWGANPMLISKLYASVSAMNEDDNPISDLTGEALKPGQIVAIVPSDPTAADAGAVYRYFSAGEWEYVATIGDLPALYARFDAQDAEIDRRMDAQDAEIDSRMDAQDSEIAQFKEAVQDQVDSYPMVTINGNVSNAPDEEDITTDASNRLKFANRSALYGKGYVILRREETLASQVTLQNTIYEIRYDFDLDGAVVSIPSGCAFKFAGGKIKNGYISGTLQNKTLDLENFEFDDIGDFFANYTPAVGQEILFKRGESYRTSVGVAVSTDGVVISGGGAEIVADAAPGQFILRVGKDTQRIDFSDEQIISGNTITDSRVVDAVEVGDCLAISSSSYVAGSTEYYQGVYCRVVKKARGAIQVDQVFNAPVSFVRVFPRVSGIVVKDLSIYNNVNERFACIQVTGQSCALDNISVDSAYRVSSLVSLAGYSNVLRNSRLCNAGTGDSTNYGVVSIGNNNVAHGNVIRNCRHCISGAQREWQAYNWECYNNICGNAANLSGMGNVIDAHANITCDYHDNVIHCGGYTTSAAALRGWRQQFRNNTIILDSDTNNKLADVILGELADNCVLSGNVFVNLAGTPTGTMTTRASFCFLDTHTYRNIIISNNVGFGVRYDSNADVAFDNLQVTGNQLGYIGIAATFLNAVISNNVIRNLHTNGAVDTSGQNVFLNVKSGSLGLYFMHNLVVRDNSVGAIFRITNAVGLALVVCDNILRGISPTPNTLWLYNGTDPAPTCIWQRNQSYNLSSSSISTINQGNQDCGPDTSLPSGYPKGFLFFNTTDNVPVWGTGHRWVRGDGFTLAARSGATADRPTTLKPADVGFQFLDTTLGKPIYAKSITSGGVVTWVDAAGDEV